MPNKLVLSRSYLTMLVGEQSVVIAALTDGQPLKAQLKWDCSLPSIEVRAQGQQVTLVAQQPGSGILTAQYDGLRDECQIHVVTKEAWRV